MFDNIILASPTYGMGELQDDWASVIDEVADMDFSGKVVAFCWCRRCCNIRWKLC